jgi:hypothetical protein
MLEDNRPNLAKLEGAEIDKLLENQALSRSIE